MRAVISDCWSQDSQGRVDFLLCSGERRGGKDSQEKTTSHFNACCSLLPLQKCLQKKNAIKAFDQLCVAYFTDMSLCLLKSTVLLQNSLVFWNSLGKE